MFFFLHNSGAFSPSILQSVTETLKLTIYVKILLGSFASTSASVQLNPSSKNLIPPFRQMGLTTHAPNEVCRDWIRMSKLHLENKMRKMGDSKRKIRTLQGSSCIWILKCQNCQQFCSKAEKNPFFLNWGREVFLLLFIH